MESQGARHDWVTELTVDSEVELCWIKYSWLCLSLFYNFECILPLPLAFKVSTEKSSYNQMRFPLYVTCYFSLVAFNISSLYLFFINLLIFVLLEKEMATHSSILAWRIPGKEEPGGLLSMGSHRVGHDWSDLAVAAACYWKWASRGRVCLV